MVMVVALAAWPSLDSRSNCSAVASREKWSNSVPDLAPTLVLGLITIVGRWQLCVPHGWLADGVVAAARAAAGRAPETGAAWLAYPVATSSPNAPSAGPAISGHNISGPNPAPDALGEDSLSPKPRIGAMAKDPAATLATMTPDLVPPFPDDAFHRVLCVVAHPDDVEYGTSSAVASWTARGSEVAYLLLTRGEAGIDGSPPEQTAQLRTEEQIAGARAVGVSEVEFLDYPDGMLEYGLGMRRDIARVIRRHQPDAVVVGPWDVEFPAGLNQADHRVAGLAALDAVRDAGNRWVFPELLDEGLQPHATRWLLVAGNPEPTHGVDVTGEPLERGIASLEAHGQYLAGIPGHPAPRTMITAFTAWQGKAMGVPHAVLFRAWDFQAPPPLAAEILATIQDEPGSA
jgi:LmbE family N-acetylglucosaminyl deacetylase